MIPDVVAKSLLEQIRGDDRGETAAVFLNPAIYVLSGVLIGMTLVDTIRESVRAKQFDKMLEAKLEDTVDELQQLRADRDARKELPA